MDTKVNELTEPKKKNTVTVTLSGVPKSVHNRVAKYRTQLTGKHERNFTMKEAYVEFLKEAAKSI